LLLLSGWNASAVAQLSGEDIEALRQRGQAEGWTFSVAESQATTYPLEWLCGAVEPPDWRDTAIFDPCEPQRNLPVSFSWFWGGVTPIRDQGPCGSCWAFGAVGAMECAIRLRYDGIQDLAEQWLVSCTTAGSCSGGWHTTSFDYLKCNGLKDPCGGTGAVMEADFPYKASDVPCGCPYSHPFCLDSWAAVGYQWSIPSVEQIKQAILDHGPVAVCVYVNDAFQAYHGGVFNACEDHWINHVVVLIGWDDRKGTSGAWRLRNSWGASWGESGYMWIEYGCCRVGYATCYVEYDWQDCNNNGIHDALDIRRKISLDCNANLVPDECDLATGLSADCNANGIPDECDIASGYSQDANGDGVPDECGFLVGDLNCDGVVNLRDVNPFVLALSKPHVYAQTYPHCPFGNRDINGDGSCDFNDINPFVLLLAR
jgi:hypothetical protein